MNNTRILKVKQLNGGRGYNTLGGQMGQIKSQLHKTLTHSTHTQYVAN